MKLTASQLRELNNIIYKYNGDEIGVMGIPGSVTNNGKEVSVIEVTIGVNKTKKLHKRIYRGMPNQFEEWLKRAIDRILNV